MADCITIKLTTEQQNQLRRLTGMDGDALVIPTEQLEELLTSEEQESPGDFEEFVWECLNPYP